MPGEPVASNKGALNVSAAPKCQLGVANESYAPGKRLTSVPGEPAETFGEEVRRKYPTMVARARENRIAGIRMFCIECMGGSRSDAVNCTKDDCFLWPHRGYSWKK